MMVKGKIRKIIGILLSLVMLILALPLPTDNAARAEEPSPYRYVFIEGYFEYWKNPDGTYWFTPYGDDPICMGDEDPDGKFLVIRYTPITIPSTETLTNLQDYKYQWEGSDSDIDEWMNWDQLNDITNYYAYYSYAADANEVIGETGTTVTPDVVVQILGPGAAQDMGGDVYRTYTCFVATFTDNDYIEDPVQWKIDHGLLDPAVYADLDGDHDDELEWNYKQFHDNDRKYLDIELDASGTSSDLDITDYDFELDVDGEVFADTRSSPYYSKSVSIYPEDVDMGDTIPVFGSVTATNTGGYSDTATYNGDVYISVVNDRPDAYFTNTQKPYATLPMTLTDHSSDPEDDLIFLSWEIRNSANDLILYSDIDLETDDISTDYTDSYFYSADFNTGGGTLNFKQEGYYNVELTVYDKGDSSLGLSGKSDTYSKTIYVNSEPQPPVADFNMYEFSYPDEAVPITDASTDPNNDIVSRYWTEPTVNKDDGTPADYTGHLSGLGGTLTFHQEGTYDISLRVVDYLNLEDSITKEIKVIPPIPVARITAEGTLKRNRLVTLHSRDSLSPRTDPIQTERNIWSITPLDGQDPDSIKIDPDTSNLEEKNIVFKETGRYEVYLKVHNNFGDEVEADPEHPNREDLGACEITEVITIEEDLDPVSDFSIGGATPNFIDNPVSTTVDIQQLAYSLDADIIDKFNYTVYRDMDEDGDFSDESIYATYNEGDTAITVYFEQDVSGMFKVDLEVTEEFGQPTIDKYVLPGDRRTNTVSKTFSVNWIPDIVFDIPDWAYTDDTIDITTSLQDERIDTLDVDWHIRRADETDTGVMVDDDIDERTEYELNNDGGEIRFTDSGYYELTATVTDEIGQSYTYSDFIRIYPLPTAVISDDMPFRDIPFTTKENRKYKLNGNASYADDYYGAEMHPIDHSRDYWEIIPLEGQDANQVIKVANGIGSLLSDTLSPTIYDKSDNYFQEDLLFRSQGTYLIRYQVTNTHGKKSPFAEQVVNVVEDTEPIIDFETVSLIYRNPDDNKLAEMVAFNLISDSDDDDILAGDLHRLRYRFDSDNDGSYADETWSDPLDIDFINKRAAVKVPHVGRYQFEFFVKDTYGQETLNQFVTDADRRTSTVIKEVHTDNMPPNVDFAVTPSNKVDVVFTIGEIQSSKIQELNTKIENYVQAYLEANNADFIDTNIEMIETSTISSEDADAGAIFNQWENYPYEGIWRYVPSTKIIETTQNTNWSGFLSPEEAGDVEIEYETRVSPDNDNDNNGFTFSFHWQPLYTGYALILDNGGAKDAGLWRFENVSNVHSGGQRVATFSGFDGRWTTSWTKFKIVRKGANIKVWREGVKVIDWTDPDPLPAGSFGPFAYSQRYSQFRNVKITTGSIKSLDEVLKEPEWREDSTRFVVNLSDVELPELDPGNPKYPVILSRMLDDGIYFAELGTGTNRVQMLDFIADNDGKGIFIYNDNPDMDTALQARDGYDPDTQAPQSLAEYILYTVRNTARPTTQYILLNEEINYELFYTDYEDDPQMDEENWKYDHDPDYYENSLGQVDYHNEWLSEPKKSFDKTGKFTTEYETRDNPVGTDDRFDDYRKTSQMINGPLNIFVHRKPVAQFTAGLTKQYDQVENVYTQTNIDFSGEGGTYAQWQPSFTAPSGTIKTIEFRTPRADDDYWYNAGELYVQGYKNGTWYEIKNYNDRAYTSDPIQDTINVDGQGYTQVRFYFRMRDRSGSAQGSPSGSYYKITTETIEQTGFTVSYTDNSYDTDHQLLAEGYYTLDGDYNLIPADSETGTWVDDKGIIEKQWEWKEVGEDTWHRGQLLNGSADREYYVRLRVRDIDGENFLGAWSDAEVVLITLTPLPPIAQFTITPSVLPVDRELTIRDNSYDPNGDAIAEREWKLYREGSLLGVYSDTGQVIDYSGRGTGQYRLELRVRDETGLWSDVYVQNFKVIPVNQAPVADFDPQPNPAMIRDSIDWNENSSDPEGHPITREWTLERYEVQDISDISGVPDDIYTYTGTVPFTGSFEGNGLPYGAYKVTLAVTDSPPVPPYRSTDAGTSYKIVDMYVVPGINVTGSFEGEAVTGETITLKAVTNEHVTNVRVEFLGDDIPLTMVSSDGADKYWEGGYTIPGTVGSSGYYTARFTAETTCGGEGSVTGTAVYDLVIYVTALKLENFRITGMVNHPGYTFPIVKDDLPVNYKTGYYVTFRIDSLGTPDRVQVEIEIDGSPDQTVDMTQVGTSGPCQVWEGRYYAGARTATGSVITVNLVAVKGGSTYDYNTHEGWDGRVLIVTGTALEDARVNRIY